MDAIDSRLAVVEFWGTLIHRELYNSITLSQGGVFEDQGNKFKLYLRSKKNVILLEQLYGYRIREGSIMRRQSSLEKELDDLQFYTYNWDKLVYYADVSNYNVEKIRETYIEKLNDLYTDVNLGEEDNKIYREAINKQKQKLQRYWNM